MVAVFKAPRFVYVYSHQQLFREYFTLLLFSNRYRKIAGDSCVNGAIRTYLPCEKLSEHCEKQIK